MNTAFLIIVPLLLLLFSLRHLRQTGNIRAFALLSFAPAAIVAIILSAVEVVYWVQIIVFVVSSIVLTLVFRPIVKKAFIKPTIATNITDVNIGKQLRLTADAVDGISSIKLNGVVWTAKFEDEVQAKKGRMVEIVSSKSNEFVVKLASEEAGASQNDEDDSGEE